MKMNLGNFAKNLYQAASDKAVQFARRHPRMAVAAIMLYNQFSTPDYKIPPSDIGFAIATIDPEGDFVRFERKETGSDWTRVSEKGPDGRWLTRSYR